MKTLKEEREAIVEAIKDYDENVGWVCYPDDVATALLSHEEKVVARVREDILNATFDVMPAPDNAKDFMGDFERGVVEGGYYVKKCVLEALTLPITDENV